VARFVISHRISGAKTEDERKRSRSRFNSRERAFAEYASFVADRSPEQEERRRTIFAEGEPADFQAMRRELPADIIIEPERPRVPAVFFPLRAAALATAVNPGIGAAIDITLRSQTSPLAEALVSVMFTSLRDGTTSVSTAETDAGGNASVAFDSRLWVATLLSILPRQGAWSWRQSNPAPRVSLDLPPLPRNGPLGWWHYLLGISRDNPGRGERIRVGVVDTGIGPHPYLAHVRGAGAYVSGSLDDAPRSSADVDQHGTHVTGIIAARPSSGSGDFAGIAPGADVVVARVYPGGGPPSERAGAASNGDIANAIDDLSDTHAADVINLSLGGNQPSEIEADAISAALERGALVICAAGNTNGGPVIYPAAYPQAVAVSAIGVLGAAPAGTIDAASTASQWDRYTASGVYAAEFNAIGPELECTAPGVAVISTVPGDAGAPYAAMSGTSMAAPAVSASLATWLSNDPAYARMPRDIQRAARAWNILFQTLRPLGLNQRLQGYGLASAWPS
jgi:subtilisin family serine protease